MTAPTDVTAADESTSQPPAVPPNEDLEDAEPDEIIVRVSDDQAIVFCAPTDPNHSRWERLLARHTRSELKSLLQVLDPASRTMIEVKRWTGALVELHPADRDLLKSSRLKAISEEGGWLQANWRDQGQVKRLMRIRPATGVAAVSGGALIVAAIAAQAQAAEMAQDIKAIRQQVDEIAQHLNDDQVGGAAHAVDQVEKLVEMLRAHGGEGIRESDVSAAQSDLGKARFTCIQHLKSAVAGLEDASRKPARHAEQILADDAVKKVVLYCDLSEKLYTATIKFGFAQVALDYHAGKPEVARTRAEQVIDSIDGFRREIEDVRDRLSRLDDDVRAGFQPWWKRVGKDILLPAGVGTIAGAGVALAATAVAEATAESDDADESDGEEEPQAGPGAALGSAIGLAAGLGFGVRNTVLDSRASKPLEERLGQLTAARDGNVEPMGEAALGLDWLRAVTAELAPSDI